MTRRAWNRTHGRAGTPLYRVWLAMLNRCYDPNVASYRNYGGRGITVCERWQTSFANFLADMGERPSDEHSIDRKNNNGPYSPENCIWALRSDQVKNKRNTRHITANGETLHLAEWARRLGCNPAAILYRINSGMSEADAVTQPIADHPNATLNQEQANEIRRLYSNHGGSLSTLAAKFNVSRKTISNIINNRIWLGK